jgi:hypothetical protein
MIRKPQATEHPPYAAHYIALAAASNNILELLTAQMESTPAFFKSLPADKANYRYAPGKWTIKEMLCHIIDTERIFAYRALCFARGEQQNLPGFEQNDYAANSEAASRVMTGLIAEYKAVRMASICLFNSLSTMQAERIGLLNAYPATAGALAYMIAGHELHHFNILKEKYL